MMIVVVMMRSGGNGRDCGSHCGGGDGEEKEIGVSN